MRKKRLESMKALELSIEGEGTYAIEAQIANIDGVAVLEVDLWDKKRADGSRGKICRHFVYNDKYTTLFESEQSFDTAHYVRGQWSTMSFITIQNKGCWNYYSYYVNDTDYSESTGELIFKFTGEKYKNPIYALEYYESEQKENERRKAAIRKQDRINALMESVSSVTQDEDFQNWLDQVVFPERYIFVETAKKKRGYRCYCATCGRMYYEKVRAKHNYQSKCPKCGTEAVAKTRTKEITKKKNVLVAQAVDESRWIFRHFEFWETCGIKKENMKNHSYGYRDIDANEKVRMFIGGGEMQGITLSIYWGQKYKEVDEAQLWWDKKSFPQKIDSYFFFYPGRLQEACMHEGLKRILTAGAQAGVELPYNIIVRWYAVKDYRYIEYLIKGKLDRLAAEIVTEYEYGDAPTDLLNMEADNLSGLLRLSKQQKDRLKQINGRKYALRLLQEEKISGKVSQENLLYAEKYKILPDDLQIDRTGLSLNKMLNYVRRQSARNKMPPKKILEYYKDYLNMAAERGADLTDSIICTNNRILEFHDAYLEEKNRAADEKRAAELEKKYPNIKKHYHKNLSLFGWENDTYEIVVPQTVKDIIKEGRKQHHCVAASNHYFELMNAGTSYILFLRKKENRNAPYYTLQVEISNGNINILQWYAAYNRKPDAAAVKKVLSQWKKEVNNRLNEPLLLPA